MQRHRACRLHRRRQRRCLHPLIRATLRRAIPWAAFALSILLVACGTDDGRDPNRAAAGEEERLEREAGRAEPEGERIGRRSRRDRVRPSTPSLAGLGGLEQRLGARIGATLGLPGRGPIAAGGKLRSEVAWSTIKVPIALRVLAEFGGPSGLSSSRKGAIERALTASDNDAAAALFDALAQKHGGIPGAAAAVTEVLREAGDDVTMVSTQGRDGFSPYGQTNWSLIAQHRFMAAFVGGCLANEAAREFVLDLMGGVTSDPWGLGSADVPARWKGGWGPDADGGYLLRQMGVLEVGTREVVVTLAVRPNDGTFESGQGIATEVARWLVEKAESGLDGHSGC